MSTMGRTTGSCFGLAFLVGAAGCAPKNGAVPLAPPTAAPSGVEAPHRSVAEPEPSPEPTPVRAVKRGALPSFEEISWAGAGTVLAVRSFGGGRALAVGEAGAIWVTPPEPASAGGASPRVAPFPDGIPVAVWVDPGSTPDFAVAVGYQGLAWVLEDNDWTRVETGIESDLLAVWASHVDGERVVYAGGQDGVLGLIERRAEDGAWAMVPMEAPESATIHAFAGAGRAVWAVGARSGSGEPPDGMILRLADGRWIDACPELACGGVVYAAWAASERDLWTAGGGGELVRYTDGVPRWIHSGTRVDLTSIWGSGAEDLFVAGDEGTLLHGDGTDWKPLDPGLRHDLRGIDGSPSGEVWAVGSGGTILHLPPPGSGG